METTTGCTANTLKPTEFKTIPDGLFSISSQTKKSKTIEFFEDLYTYPPKFRVKWDAIDELNNDSFMLYNYRVNNPSLPFNDVLTNFFQNEGKDTIKETKYSLKEYVNGYFNKIASTSFYGKHTKKLQTSLQGIPVYTILNGQGEIVLANSTDQITSNNTKINGKAYDFCGNFDQQVEKSVQLGLFFMSQNDAEMYLNEIARSDTEGTKMFGLSVHCFGLDFAYRLTREYHPNIDFRFIPDLEEVNTLMTKGSNVMIFEDSQQQLRTRKRDINIVPILGSIGKRISPFSSFIEKNEYFKGVPIYVVQINQTNNNFFVEQYFNTINLLDSIYGRIVNAIDIGIGFGNNWIMQGSIQEQTNTATTKQTYIFFEQKAATKFCQQYGRQVARYSGSQSRLLEPIIKKPKIFVHNLEDFLELWEDTLAKNQVTNIENKEVSIFDSQSLHIIPARKSALNVENYLQQEKKSNLKRVAQFLDFKYRRLVGFTQTLLNTN